MKTGDSDFENSFGQFHELHFLYILAPLKILQIQSPDVKVPSVVFVVSDVDPIVVGDHPLVQRQDRLIPCLDPSHL